MKIPTALGLNVKRQALMLTDPETGVPLRSPDTQNIDLSSGSDRRRNGWNKRHTSALKDCSLGFKFGDFVHIMHSDSLYDLTTACTIQIRFRADNLYDEMWIVAKGDVSGTISDGSTSDVDYTFFIRIQNTGAIDAGIVDTNSGTATQRVISSTTGVITEGVEYEVEYILASGTHTLYVNGSSVATASDVAENVKSTNYPIYLGTCSTGARFLYNDCFVGTMAKFVWRDTNVATATLDGERGRQLYDSEIDSNVKGYWPLDDGDGLSTRDRSGNNNPGHFGFNGASLETGKHTSLRGDSSLLFDGLDDVIAIPDADELPATFEGSNTQWTLQVTVNPLIKNQDVDGPVVELGDGTNNNFVIRHRAASWECQIYDDAAGSKTLNSTSTPTVGTTHVITIRKNGTAVELFIDGSSEDSDTMAADSGKDLTNPIFWVGGGSDSGWKHYHGYVDELRIWNRALSDQEVSDNSSGYKYDSDEAEPLYSEMVGYWKFDRTFSIPPKLLGTVNILDSALTTVNGRGTNFQAEDRYKWIRVLGDTVFSNITAVTDDDTLTIGYNHPAGGTDFEYRSYEIVNHPYARAYEDLSVSKNHFRDFYFGIVNSGPISTAFTATTLTDANADFITGGDGLDRRIVVVSDTLGYVQFVTITANATTTLTGNFIDYGSTLRYGLLGGPQWDEPIISSHSSPAVKGLSIWSDPTARPAGDNIGSNRSDLPRQAPLLDIGPRLAIEESSGTFKTIARHRKALKKSSTNAFYSDFASMRGRFFVVDGVNPNGIYDGELRRLGISPPITPPGINYSPPGAASLENERFDIWDNDTSGVPDSWTLADNGTSAADGDYATIRQGVGRWPTDVIGVPVGDPVGGVQGMMDTINHSLVLFETGFGTADGDYVEISQGTTDIASLKGSVATFTVRLCAIRRGHDVEIRDKVEIKIAEDGGTSATGAAQRSLNLDDYPDTQHVLDEESNFEDVSASLEIPAGATTITCTIRLYGGAGVAALVAAESGRLSKDEIIGDRRYLVTYFNDKTATESNPSPLSVPVKGVPLGTSVPLKDIPVSPDPQVTRRRIYRTQGGGLLPFLCGELYDNITTTYTDTSSDQELVVRTREQITFDEAGGLPASEAADPQRTIETERYSRSLSNIPIRYDRWSPPSCRLAHATQGLLILASPPSFPNRIYVSTGESPEHFAYNRYFDTDDGDGDRLTAIYESAGNVIFFKNESAWVTSNPNPSTGAVQKISNVLGPCNHRVMANCEGVPIYLHLGQTGAGVYRLASGVESVLLSQEIEDFFTDSLDRDATIMHGHAAYYKAKSQYWLAVCTSSATIPDTVLVLDLPTGKWNKYTNLRMMAFLPYDDVGTQKLLGLSADGFLVDLDTNDNDGVGSSGPWAGKTADSMTSSTLTDSSETFPTTGDGLRGCPIRVTDTDDGTERDGIILRNTATVLTLDSDLTGTGPYTYSIGYIDAYIKTPWLDFGYPTRTKFLSRMRTHHESQTHSGTVSLNTYLDRGSTSSDTATFAMNSDTYQNPAIKLRGRLFQFEWKNVEPDQPWDLISHDAEAKVRGVR